MFNNIYGNANTAVGWNAGTFTGQGGTSSSSGGNNNTSIGYRALYGNTLGNDNTAVGFNALQANATGTQNTTIGSGADVASGALTNATAIGYGAIATASNTVQLGNTSVTNVKTSGSITAGSGSSTIAGSLVVGAAAATGTSAALEIKSTSQGLLLPRLTTAQRNAISAPLAGLLIYNSSAGKAQVYTEQQGSPATLANPGSSAAGLGSSYDYNICLSFTPTSNWSVSSVSIGVQAVASAGNMTLSLYSGVPGSSSTLLGSQTAATSTLSGGAIVFNFSTPVTVPQGSCYWKLTADNTAFIFLPRLNQFNDGVNESFTALRNNNTVVVNIPSYSFQFSMDYIPLGGTWADLN